MIHFIFKIRQTNRFFRFTTIKFFFRTSSKKTKFFHIVCSIFSINKISKMIPRLALFSGQYYRLLNNQMSIVRRNKAYYRSGAVKVRKVEKNIDKFSF